MQGIRIAEEVGREQSRVICEMLQSEAKRSHERKKARKAGRKGNKECKHVGSQYYTSILQNYNTVATKAIANEPRKPIHYHTTTNTLLHYDTVTLLQYIATELNDYTNLQLWDWRSYYSQSCFVKAQ